MIFAPFFIFLLSASELI